MRSEDEKLPQYASGRSDEVENSRRVICLARYSLLGVSIAHMMIQQLMSQTIVPIKIIPADPQVRCQLSASHISRGEDGFVRWLMPTRNELLANVSYFYRRLGKLP